MLRAETGEPIGEPEAAALFSARGAELERLLVIASRLRDEGLVRAGRPGVITYSKKVFIPLTHLCRDRCHYCVFVETPGQLAATGRSMFMEADAVIEVARQGAALGCKEALFTLGDRPEDRWQAAREWLDAHGYASTLEYVRDMAVRVVEETGMLPHLNPGVMSWAELQRLRPVAPSMGMMLETTSARLWNEPGSVHYGSPDKDPALRLRVLEDAGRSRIPFSTGVLLGIGENDAERAEALFAIRAADERHGHVQETIVQNFRAKPRTAMQNEVDLALEEYAANVAVARVVLGADATIQVPPNLTDAAELAILVRAGISDWGGVSPLTADHVNPERPWPQLDELARLTADAGYELRERLTAHAKYVLDPQDWIDRRILPAVQALAGEDGLAVADRKPVATPFGPVRPRAGGRVSEPVRAALLTAAADPAGLTDGEYLTLLAAAGDDLDALTDLADDVRHASVGDDVTFVVNRNLDPAAVVRNGVLDETLVTALVDEAWELGATEICIQGAVPADAPADTALRLLQVIAARRPGLHVHGFRPAEVADAAARLGLAPRAFLEAARAAGLGSVPGTAARILDDDVRARYAGAPDLSVAAWTELVTTAHAAGLRSTATMVYGHVETPEQQLAHLRTLARIQDDTGGFTEFIAMPHVPLDGPPHLLRVGRQGPDARETRALHAVARLVLHGRIDHLQAAWTKLGTALAQDVLRGGVDDLGGLLLDGALLPGAGAEEGRELSLADIARLTSELGRGVRQRNTDYTDANAERMSAARAAAARRPEPVRMRLPPEPASLPESTGIRSTRTRVQIEAR